MKKYIFLMFFFVSLSLLYPQNNTIYANEAYKYVGEIKTVCGKVESVFYSYRSNGKPTFLNIDKAYPNNEFMVVIWGNNRYKFKPNPEKKYLKKKICVTGRIKTYNGTAEIVVTNPNQIDISKQANQNE
ncbi:DNA-binding protein [Candidatus Neomarinimicrobiota bacterium]